MPKNFYITTPIFFPSGRPHIGTIYSTILSDVMARWKKFEGYEVFFTTGMDEHAQNVIKNAEKEKMEPQAFVDIVANYFEEAFKLFNIDYDKFVRTTNNKHKKYCQNLVESLFKKGDIYKGKYEGWYCTSCETYYTEKELVDGSCPLHKKKATWMEEESYFFKMSKYQKKVEDYIKKSNYIFPKTRQDFILKRMKEGVRDLCISRENTGWGTPLPFDKSHILWVWFDALPNYVSSTDIVSKKKFWPADIHVIAHDILWHHSVIWLSMLFAAGIKPPKKVFVHGFVNAEGGGKMSKSLGNVVDPMALSGKYPIDSIRYFLLREIPFGTDGAFSEKALITRHNSELANDLGNLLSRVTSMINKYYSGKVPPKSKDELSKSLNLKKIKDHMEKFEIHNALAEIWKFINKANKYVNDNKPWELAKDNPKRLNVVIYNLADALRMIAILLKPFLPTTALEIGSQLGIKDFKKLGIKDVKFGKLNKNSLVDSGLLFTKVEVKEDKKMVKEEKVVEKKELKMHDTIPFKDFSKLDIRIGTVTKIKPHPDADKLYVMMVKVFDCEPERQIVAGLKKHYEMDQLLGKKVAVIVNLQPAVLRGIESQGMILAADDGENVVLMAPEKDIKNSAKIR